MWHKQKLALPSVALNTLGGSAPFSLSAMGQKIAVHNWTHGKTEPSGRYLSPENAVKAVAAKFSDYADPNRPKGNVQVICLLITAATPEPFIAQLEQMANVLDYSEVKQALSYAKSYANLQVTKMVKTPVINSPAFGVASNLSTTLSRKMEQTVSQAVDSLTATVGDPFAMLDQLKQVKKLREQARGEFLQNIAKIAPLDVWLFTASGQLDVIAQNLLQNVPTSENVYSLLLAFVSEDLSSMTKLFKGDE